MAFISKAEVERLLADHINDIWEIVNGGYKDYVDSYDERHKLLHCPTTKASIIHDHQVARAATYAFKNSVFGTKLLEFSKLKILLIGDKFAIRFKKLNPDKKSSNQPTQQVKDFLSQEALPGIHTTHNLEAGYIVNGDDNNDISIYLTCPSSHKTTPYWHVELFNGKVEQVESELFEHTKEVENSDDEVIIQPKKTQADVIQLKAKKNED